MKSCQPIDGSSKAQTKGRALKPGPRTNDMGITRSLASMDYTTNPSVEQNPVHFGWRLAQPKGGHMAEDTRKGDIGNNVRNPNGQPTPFERFEDFVRKIAAVPKEELNEQRAKHKQEKGKKTNS